MLKFVSTAMFAVTLIAVMMSTVSAHRLANGMCGRSYCSPGDSCCFSEVSGSACFNNATQKCCRSAGYHIAVCQLDEECCANGGLGSTFCCSANSRCCNGQYSQCCGPQSICCPGGFAQCCDAMTQRCGTNNGRVACVPK